MELIIDLEPITRFDTGTTPMFASFLLASDFAPYRKLDAKANLSATDDAFVRGIELSEH